MVDVLWFARAALSVDGVASVGGISVAGTRHTLRGILCHSDFVLLGDGNEGGPSSPLIFA